MKKIGFALQGGGILGAYQAAILYEVSKNNDFEVISGASIGAVNACLLYGGNRQVLKDFWFELGDELPDEMPDFFKIGKIFLTGAKNFTAPRMDFWNIFFDGLYVSQPEPFVKIIEKYVDFKKINSLNKPEIIISATDIKNGKPVLFKNKQINSDNLCASFSIPEVFPFKNIDENYYWDGAFTRNPAILPMIDHKPDEIWVIRLLPEKGEIPENKDELKLRMNEITVNNSTNLELEFIEKLNNFSKKVPGFKNYYNKIEIKQARLDVEIQSYSALFAEKKFIRKLWEKGIEDSKIFKS